jgi:hypothetical protein
VLEPQVHAELRDAHLVGPQPAAAHVLANREEEDRPVRDAVLPLPLDLGLEPRSHLLWRELAARTEEPRHPRVTPQAHGELEVLVAPGAEPEPGRSEEDDADGSALAMKATKFRDRYRCAARRA